MNYRHIYHAGNMCDVVKHAVLCLLLKQMGKKEKGFAVLDTHAGCGLYDLNDPCALKTNEADLGVHRVWQARAKISEILAPYVEVLNARNIGGVLRYYSGSPKIAQHFLRPQDRLIACELHPEDVRPLYRAFKGDTQTQIHHRDGYEALSALLPFPEKRGLILIDPPFENSDEIKRLVKAATTIHARMAGAVVAIWYPIKERSAIWHFHEALIEAGLPKLLMAEFMFNKEDRADRLNGSGFIIMNPPWKLQENIQNLFIELHRILLTESQITQIKPLTEL